MFTTSDEDLGEILIEEGIWQVERVRRWRAIWRLLRRAWVDEMA